jgi:hypothetical protein
MLTLVPLVLALASEPAERNGRKQCEAVRVTSPEQDPKQGVFSASEAQDLRITTTFSRRLEGRHRLQLQVLTPQGHLYQKLSVPFDATVASEHRGPAPKRTIGVRLPVAGTAITTNGLYGLWSVVPYLDNETVPCAREQRFVLEP